MNVQIKLNYTNEWLTFVCDYVITYKNTLLLKQRVQVGFSDITIQSFNFNDIANFHIYN